MKAFVTLGVIGTGLIGASIGLRGRDLGWRVAGFDTNAAQANAALDRGAIDEIVGHDAIYEQADTVVIAVPPRATVAELEALRGLTLRAQLVLDVASIKAPVAQAGRSVANFVATHPLAGSERSGPGAARATLFFDKAWLYVPPLADKALEMRARDFIGAMGARAVPADAGTHDDLLALTSHVPQLLATLFSKTVRQQKVEEIEAFCGPVARELMRLGNSNVEMWREIFAYNSANVAKHARELASKLNAAAEALVSKPAEGEKD
ncbi:MAG TPA: prephenate dehydrogenase/arogenate dehydrogenase family protein [Candidatus Rubrimentiphilum sp.]|nr:prephenate dehydrogenase/arogenate dehydrogenase family protein [Candidatus Rubrimentiphilum sp.]